MRQAGAGGGKKRRRAIDRLIFGLGGLLLCLLLGAWAWVTCDIFRLRRDAPEQTAYMRLRIDEAAAAGRKLAVHQTFIPLPQISEHLTRAVLIAEDLGFHRHRGIDFDELGIALREAWQKRRAPRGASTISQQLARNLYLSPGRSYLRKLAEAVLALELELILSKPRILELYLNSIEWGDGVFGCEAAARAWYRTGCRTLSVEQAVGLASIIINPRRYRPDDARPRMVERRRFIRERLAASKDR